MRATRRARARRPALAKDLAPAADSALPLPASRLVLLGSTPVAASSPTPSPDRRPPAASSCLGPPGPRWPDPLQRAFVPARGGRIRPSAPLSRLATVGRAGGCPHKDSDEGSSCRRYKLSALHNRHLLYVPQSTWKTQSRGCKCCRCQPPGDNQRN
ncbi:hypothetical protein BS78_10G020100 [Paspalum vaginatum]|nr:hypothetical protein BS78_10G020100 [Paspalum vaginatum]